ncbi:DUF1223 domain-containing protein [Arenicella sp. 4NH20-0111]|uniref:DUF1223 domain-containing protein n=1 Tax=Arenicella sp. 4NH20-0111 TaxID=3127648 RepID=UPI00333ECED0
MKFKSIMFAFTGALLSIDASAREVFESSEYQVSLIELYTSEGCSSCPPADRWLSKLKAQQGLWKSFIPVAFHVDYWNYIGWADPYASRSNSQRQRRYAVEYGENTVYTPGLRLNGKEWRRWRKSTGLPIDPMVLSGKLTLTFDADGSFEAIFEQSAELERVQLSIALLGMGLTQSVTRGENKGKTLTHDFVVLDFATFASSGENEWRGQLMKPDVSVTELAIAAWVSKAGRLTPIQAVGGPIVFENP